MFTTTTVPPVPVVTAGVMVQVLLAPPPVTPTLAPSETSPVTSALMVGGYLPVVVLVNSKTSTPSIVVMPPISKLPS